MSGPDAGRRLVVVRHAKAEAGEGVSDHDRSLTAKGRHDAHVLGGRLGGSGPFGRVLVSSARRTRETWAAMAPGLPGSAEPEELRALYLGGVATLLDLVRGTGEDVPAVLVVGHNPTVHEVVVALSGDAPGSFPTGTAAVLDVTGPWSGLDAARLVEMVKGR